MDNFMQNSDIYVPLIAFAVVLVLNLVSMLLVFITPYGKDWLQWNKKSTGGKVFFVIWFTLCGLAFWPTVGLCKIIEKLRSSK